MSTITRALPGLFGGVSQQIPAMRHPTHAEAQDNGMDTLVDGLYKRPGTNHVALLALAGPGSSSVTGSNGAAYGHVIDKASAGKYMLVLVNGNLMLYDLLTGAAQTVAFPDGIAYLNTSNPEEDFRCVTVADYTFVVNKDKTVTMAAAADAVNDNTVAFINVRTAVASVEYKVVVNGITATVTSAATPNNASIAAQLLTALGTALPTYSVSAVAGTNIIRVSKAATPMTCAVFDGWGNSALQCLSNGVPRYADLPPVFTAGFTVTITGTADSTREAYYVKWVTDRWVEAKKPALADTFTSTTMPHQLRPDGAGGWIFEKAPWATRKVGDDDTCPLPSFVGEKLRDVFFFRNRLGFLSADGLVMSRSGDYFSFFPTSASQVLDTDPIDLSSTAADVETLDWAVVYNKSLLVFAASKQQFRLEGGDVLSPATARLMPATTFESYNGARPALLGNKVLFAATAGESCLVNLYRVDDARVSDAVEDLTEHVPRYIPKEPRLVEASTVMKAAVVIPSGVTNELYFFKYELDKDDRMTQKSWKRFLLAAPEPTRIIKAYWDSRKLHLLTHRVITGDLTAGGRFFLEVMDFEEGINDVGASLRLRLDQRVLATFVSTDGTNSVMRVPYVALSSGLVPLLCSPGLEPTLMAYTAAATTNVGTMTTDLTLPGDLTGLSVWVGRPYPFTYTFTTPVYRDRDGVPVLDASLRLGSITVKYESTGWFSAVVSHRLRGVYTYPFSGRAVGVPGQGLQQLGLSSGKFRIPTQAMAADASITLSSSSYLPCRFPYAEWDGDVTMRASR